MKDRIHKGTQVYAQSFGVEIEALLPAMTQRVGAIYAEEAILAAGGPAWSHPALTDRDRSIAILTALICQGVLGDRLDSHLNRAVANGLTKDALEVLLVLLALYAGQAHTSVAAEEVQRFFQSRIAPAEPTTM